jgi:3-dehydroquinate synthase
MSPVLATRLRAGGRDVPLLTGPGALAKLRPTLADVGFDGRLLVVADERAAALFGPLLESAFGDAPLLPVSGDERHKTLAQAETIWTWLIGQGAQRRDALVAFGGGVVCDLVGFAAACYLRGIGVINAPTTLLAQVDASVGGKTGVNHPHGKNLIGAFHQPLAVVADTELLATLPRRPFAAGLAEVVKMGMALDERLFVDLEARAAELAPAAAEQLAPFIARAVQLKAEVVERDERERGERMLLNYGHTIGHALEAATAYGELLHGEAVALGMRGAAHIAGRLGLLRDGERQAALLRRLGLPERWPGVDADAVLGRLSLDKKRVGSRQRWVLAQRVGRASIHDDVPPAVVREAVELVLTS